MSLTSPALILLNGPPGAGKSTLAEALAQADPQVTALDVDVVKHALPQWPEDPRAAGLAAREQVLSMAREELAQGRSVVIGQLLARPEFALALEQLATTTGASFVHVVLVVPADALRARLAARRASPTRAEQAVNDAGATIEEAVALGARIAETTARLDHVRRIDASGPMEPVLRALEALLEAGAS